MSAPTWNPELGTRNGASDSERFQDRETSSRNVW